MIVFNKAGNPVSKICALIFDAKTLILSGTKLAQESIISLYVILNSLRKIGYEDKIIITDISHTLLLIYVGELDKNTKLLELAMTISKFLPQIKVQYD